MRIAAYGIAIDLPSGWDGRLYSRPLTEPPPALPAVTGSPFYQPPAAAGGAATLHAANFPLPAEDGDFGTGATSSMPRDGVFVALVEYQPGQGLEPGVGLFAPQGFPRPLDRSSFSPSALLRALPGQAGAQRFFTAAGRPLCLYAVLGSLSHAQALLSELNRVLTTVEVIRR